MSIQSNEFARPIEFIISLFLIFTDSFYQAILFDGMCLIIELLQCSKDLEDQCKF